MSLVLLVSFRSASNAFRQQPAAFFGLYAILVFASLNNLCQPLCSRRNGFIHATVASTRATLSCKMMSSETDHTGLRTLMTCPSSLRSRLRGLFIPTASWRSRNSWI
ncbi:Coproporphyrin III ferrochelatase [Frankliniella fusca]|uniref:Coproporphyrin III ferrochelatase n=1 Tax=Frankliniella fusca TaxID=407009 RepID=A0AAE1LB49_9NEOP|nr:Coproporphyrin III ferrochelatase [Frankliniella fusca]